MYIHNPPATIVISGAYEGTMPTHKDGGQHVSDCEWVYDNGKRVQARYQVDWQLWHQSESKSWFIACCMNALDFPGAVKQDIPRVGPFDFHVSEDEASNLMGAKHIPDRGQMIEKLMENHRDQAFLGFENDWVSEVDAPKIEFKREETTQ